MYAAVLIDQWAISYCKYRNFADTWILFDNSEPMPAVIASKIAGEVHILREDLYASLITRYGKKP
jgi:hypothetical protein